MNLSLSPLEYEGLEYLLFRLVRENEYRQEIIDRSDIHHMIKRTTTGIHFTPPAGPYYIVEDFGIKGICLQDGTAILIAYRLEPGSEEPAEEEFPIYIDMREFMNSESFDLDYLVWKMKEHG